MKNFSRITLIVLFMTSLGFTVQSCNTTNSITDKIENKELESKLGGTWVLKSINQTDVSKAFKGDTPTLIFDFANHQVSGNGGCNAYSGSFALLGNLYTPTPMISTKMMCPTENQELKLLELLAKNSTLIFNNYTLQFVQNGKVVLEFTPMAK